mgnify:CR=1 FL=1
MSSYFPFRHRTIALAAALTAVLAVGTLANGKHARGADDIRVPAHTEEVLERLPVGARSNEARELARLRSAQRRTPADLRAATALARRNIGEARTRSDPRYLGYAQAALAPWWTAAEPPPEVLVLRATISQSLHDFDRALVDLDHAIATNPGDPQAWVTRATILTVRGDYARAQESCTKVVELASVLAGTVCRTTIASLTGHARDAHAALSDAVTQSSQLSPDEIGWAVSSLGEFAVRFGDALRAEAHFKRALTIDPNDGYVLGAYTDLLLDQGRSDVVVRLLGSRTENEGLLLRLAIAEARIAPEAQITKEHVLSLVARFDASRARGDTVHRREESRFVLALRGDPGRALELARANWEVQREPWDVRVLVEAARAANDPGAAKSALDFVRAHGLEDPMVRGVARELEGS